MLTLSNAKKSSSPLDVSMGLPGQAINVILEIGRLTTAEKIQHCSTFSPLEIMFHTGVCTFPHI